MKKLVAIIIICLTYSGLYAQSLVIEGTVYDAKRRETIPGAAVYLNGTSVITITDGNGVVLIAGLEDPEDPGYQLALKQQELGMQVAFKELIAENAAKSLEPLLLKVFGPNNYTLSVSAELDERKDHEVIDHEFFPIEGRDHGVLSKMLEKIAAGGTAQDGGPIGTWGNSDIAPNYPTVPEVEQGEEFYLDGLREMTYEVSNRLQTYTEAGLRIKKVTASVVVNREEMTPAQIANWEEIVMLGVGAKTVDDVAFMTTMFDIPPTERPDDPQKWITNKNILVWIMALLGLLLIVLVVLAITTSNSRKKRLVRARGFVPAADGPTGYLRDDSFKPMDEEQEGFDLPSLLDENETKDVVLKREIREFTRSNPEIIAQLIRTWLRDEDV
ncbi:MAG: hypothetical protein FWG45_02685 [Oscillospiraceae bacterium]|nr:hypothetical protein [Oscillospiraceae bacterium]